MSRHHQPRAFWRLARIWFRHVRITVWLLILLVLVILLYLHNIGLPGIAQKAVIRALADRGVSLETSRIHLAWFRSIEADHVRVQPTGSGWVPRIECRRLDLHFDPLDLLRLRVVPRGLQIEDGSLVLPYEGSDGSSGQLAVTNVNALIHFTPDGAWHLDGLEGDTAGCHVSIVGSVANPELIQDWRILEGQFSETPGDAHKICKSISEFVQDLDLRPSADLFFSFDIDGAAPEQLNASLTLDAQSAESPLGSLLNPGLSVAISPMGDDVCSVINLVVQMDRIDSDVARGDLVSFSTAITCLPETGDISAGWATFAAQQLDTPWAGATGLEVMFEWSGNQSNRMPVTAELEVIAAALSTSRALGENLQLHAHASPATGEVSLFPNRFSLPLTVVEPYDLSVSLSLDRFGSFLVGATNVNLAADWSNPRVDVTALEMDWAKGHVKARAGLDLDTGKLSVAAKSDFDPQRLYSILPADAVEWLGQFTWQDPPKVDGMISLTLPAREPFPLPWPGDLRPSLYIDGTFDIGEGTFKRIPVSGAASHYTYSNRTWYLPDLTVRRPDGELHIEHRNDEIAGEFFWSVNGAVDPSPLFILVPEDATEAREVLGTLKFGMPPHVDLTVAGDGGGLSSLEAWGRLAATNIAFRGCHVDSVVTDLGVTNLMLTLNRPEVLADGRGATARPLKFDFDRGMVLISNATSRLPPMTIATVIGPDVVKAIKPYQFHEPPEGEVNGVVPLKGVTGADMQFDLEGGPFTWQRFNLEHIRGRVLWRDETVALEEMDAEFYGGRAKGEAFFDFTDQVDADFRFDLLVNDSDIQPLVVDVFNSTNRLEGRLSGQLQVTNGNTGDLQSWFGGGNARLEDGYIWSVPVFGIVSPLLDLFLPGLGSSRAKEAEGDFTITNSVIRTEKLIIRTSNMRLLYTGTVDFDANVDAVAEAEILRDTVLVGGLVSTVLMPISKAMIIEIGGTLNEPEARPLYLVPRVLLVPLNPLKLLKEMFAPPEPDYDEVPAEDPPPPVPSAGSEQSP